MDGLAKSYLDTMAVKSILSDLEHVLRVAGLDTATAQRRIELSMAGLSWRVS